SSDGEVQGSFEQHAALFMRVRVERHFGAVLHFEIRKHQVLAERRPHLAARHGPDWLVITHVNEAHNRFCAFQFHDYMTMESIQLSATSGWPSGINNPATANDGVRRGGLLRMAPPLLRE